MCGVITSKSVMVVDNSLSLVCGTTSSKVAPPWARVVRLLRDTCAREVHMWIASIHTPSEGELISVRLRSTTSAHKLVAASQTTAPTEHNPGADAHLQSLSLASRWRPRACLCPRTRRRAAGARPQTPTMLPRSYRSRTPRVAGWMPAAGWEMQGIGTRLEGGGGEASSCDRVVRKNNCEKTTIKINLWGQILIFFRSGLLKTLEDGLL